MAIFNITINISFDDEKQFYEIEEKINSACQLIYDNFENVVVKVSRDETFNMDGYQKTVTEDSIRSVNINEKKYDF